MLSNIRRVVQILWQMLYHRDMPSFINLEPKFLDLKTYPNLYEEDSYFSPIFTNCKHRAQGGFYVSEGYLFKEGKFCIPKGTHKKNSLLKSHMKEVSCVILELIKLLSF